MNKIMPRRLNYKHGNTIKTLKGLNSDKLFNIVFTT